MNFTVWYCYRANIDDIAFKTSVAKRCASQWFAKGGWECSNWPYTFAIYKDEEGGAPLFRCEVSLDFEPEFFARVLQTNEPSQI